MRDKLIQILTDANEVHNYTERKTADVILAEFRCDRCRYSAVDRLRSDRLYCMSSTNDVGLVKFDFFCAEWEGK